MAKRIKWSSKYKNSKIVNTKALLIRWLVNRLTAEAMKTVLFGRNENLS